MLHKPGTPNFFDSRIACFDGFPRSRRVNENVTHLPERVVKNALIVCQMHGHNYSENTTFDQNLRMDTAGICDKISELISDTPCSESNRDQSHGTSSSAQCPVPRPQLSFDDWVEMGSEDSWCSSLASSQMRARGGTVSNSEVTYKISIAEIVERAKTDYLIDAEFAWREHLSDAKANELVARAVDSSVADWAFDHGTDPADVPKGIRILAHAVILAAGWRTRENSEILIADVMQGSAQHVH